MLLILEIWLTVKAWRKGWKALALLQLGVALGIGFVVGAVIGASGGSGEDLWAWGLIGDLTAIVILAFMCARLPQGASTPTVPDVAEQPALSADCRAADIEAAEAICAPTANR